MRGASRGQQRPNGEGVTRSVKLDHAAKMPARPVPAPLMVVVGRPGRFVRATDNSAHGQVVPQPPTQNNGVSCPKPKGHRALRLVALNDPAFRRE
jgi:hypothetical protein